MNFAQEWNEYRKKVKPRSMPDGEDVSATERRLSGDALEDASGHVRNEKDSSLAGPETKPCGEVEETRVKTLAEARAEDRTKYQIRYMIEEGPDGAFKLIVDDFLYPEARPEP